MNQSQQWLVAQALGRRDTTGWGFWWEGWEPWIRIGSPVLIGAGLGYWLNGGKGAAVGIAFGAGAASFLMRSSVEPKQ